MQQVLQQPHEHPDLPQPRLFGITSAGGTAVSDVPRMLPAAAAVGVNAAAVDVMAHDGTVDDVSSGCNLVGFKDGTRQGSADMAAAPAAANTAAATAAAVKASDEATPAAAAAGGGVDAGSKQQQQQRPAKWWACSCFGGSATK
jgi:septal ring-binding cell division protein DamX